ncbi:MAG: hypothetical protein K2Y51_14390 [Gammaproteobacteria bacterium]|nr:hypothetical protein [Gammaproteobacteria bacterium]
MNLEDIYFLSQILAAVAIVGSLVFVGLQLRQGSLTQRALMHQATIQRTMELNTRLTDPTITALLVKARDARAAWNATEIWQLRAMIRVLVLHVEDMDWQRRAGMLDEAAFENVLTVARAVFSLPGFRICWEMLRPRITAAEQALVERLLLADVELATQSDLGARWQEIAARLYPPAA